MASKGTTAATKAADELWGENEQSELDKKIAEWTVDQIKRRSQILNDNSRIIKSDVSRLMLENKNIEAKIKENKEKIKLNKQLPYLVANVVEILDMNEEKTEEDGAAVDLNAVRKDKCVVVKTSTRQTVFLPVIGLVEAKELKPGELVGVNKDSYLILDKLPAEYDSRVKAMEVDERPTEDYGDIGGLNKQIQELREAIVRPITHADLFKKIGIKPPKGVLMYGPPGTGKTLLARACAAKTKACFLKIAATQLVQMFIGDGAKLVRDAFALARENAPAIIFVRSTDSTKYTYLARIFR